MAGWIAGGGSMGGERSGLKWRSEWGMWRLFFLWRGRWRGRIHCGMGGAGRVSCNFIFYLYFLLG